MWWHAKKLFCIQVHYQLHMTQTTPPLVCDLLSASLVIPMVCECLFVKSVCLGSLMIAYLHSRPVHLLTIFIHLITIYSGLKIYIKHTQLHMYTACAIFSTIQKENNKLGLVQNNIFASYIHQKFLIYHCSYILIKNRKLFWCLQCFLSPMMATISA